MSKDIVKYGDAAMFQAEPMKIGSAGVVSPQVFLLQATPDPLGANAAGFRMYAGKPTYSLDDITDEERLAMWEESLKTHLKAPWEFINFHFFIEGVSRAFTHQMVRQRTAAYAQESLRFAVKEGFASEIPVPPMVVANGEQVQTIWENAVQAIELAYTQLVAAGVPAEDARGLLPHCVTTRLNYHTNLRNLVETLGARLCTQAQFEWRSVAIGIVHSIKTYHPKARWSTGDWQFQTIAEPCAATFTPVCYKAGKCVFMGKLDRGCTIRERVNEYAKHGVPSSEWNLMIDPQEWLANPWAGITESEEDRPS